MRRVLCFISGAASATLILGTAAGLPAELKVGMLFIACVSMIFATLLPEERE